MSKSSMHLIINQGLTPLPHVLLPDALVRASWAPMDWNNGPGPLYYPPTLDHKDLMRRLIMHGYGGPSLMCSDFSRGRIWGVNVLNVTDLLPVGLQDMCRTPYHW
jgi:hypothetical protein